MDDDNEKFCNKVVTIPQYNETCWFNTILMSLLYSQNSRKLLLHKMQIVPKDNKLMRIIQRILKSHYINPEKTAKYFAVFKPEVILSYIIGIENKTLLKEMVYSGWYSSMFLDTFIESIGCSCLTINYFTGKGRINKLYAGITQLINFQLIGDYLDDISEITDKIKQNQHPDYICINLFNTYGTSNNYYTQMTYLQNIKKDFDLDSYGFTYSGIKELANEIEFNGNTYILDSTILSNYDIDKNDIGHAIAGITCKNLKYVYNGWMRITNDRAKKDDKTENVLPCELMKFNWNIHSDTKFCINEKLCKLPNLKNRRKELQPDLCFSFAKGNRTIIYVKKNPEYVSINTNSTNIQTSLSSQRSLHLLDTISSNKYKNLSFSSLNSADFVDGNDDKSIIQQKQLAKYFENHKIKVEARKEQKRREIAQKKLLKK
jgi:hypothetical protein